MKSENEIRARIAEMNFLNEGASIFDGEQKLSKINQAVISNLEWVLTPAPQEVCVNCGKTKGEHITSVDGQTLWCYNTGSLLKFTPQTPVAVGKSCESCGFNKSKFSPEGCMSMEPCRNFDKWQPQAEKVEARQDEWKPCYATNEACEFKAGITCGNPQIVCPRQLAPVAVADLDKRLAALEAKPDAVARLLPDDLIKCLGALLMMILHPEDDGTGIGEIACEDAFKSLDRMDVNKILGIEGRIYKHD